MLYNLFKKIYLIVVSAPLIFITLPVGAQQKIELLKVVKSEKAERLLVAIPLHCQFLMLLNKLMLQGHIQNAIIFTVTSSLLFNNAILF